MQITINGEPQEMATPLLLVQLLGQLQLESRQVAVEVNLQLIPRDQHAAYQVQPGDQVEIVTLAGGG